jgi:hypothetical protein
MHIVELLYNWGWTFLPYIYPSTKSLSVIYSYNKYLNQTFIQPLTEMSTGNIKKKIMFLGSKVRPVHGADNLTAKCEPII